MDLLILSGSSRIRTAAAANHRAYADRWGHAYVFDATPSVMSTISLHKIRSIRRFLDRHEWVFWIDDDAFFTQFDRDLRTFIDAAPGKDLVFCASPVNPRGGWTWFSAGQLFIRRTPAMLELLDTVLETDLSVVRPWWRPAEHGLFTNGDQEAFVYHLLREDSPWAGTWERLPWEAFNARPYHYESRLDEHFLCHFAVPGGTSKPELILAFAERLGTSAALCDPELLVPYRTFLERSDMWAYLDGPGGRGPLLPGGWPVHPFGSGTELRPAAAPRPGRAGSVVRARRFLGRVVRRAGRGVRRVIRPHR